MRKPSKILEHVKAIPFTPQPPVVPTLTLEDPACHVPRPCPELLVGFSGFQLRGLSLKSGMFGMPEPHFMTLPATQKETVPFGAAQNPQSGINLNAPPPEATPHLPRPTRLQTQRLMPTQNPSLNSALGKLPDRPPWGIRKGLAHVPGWLRYTPSEEAL